MNGISSVGTIRNQPGDSGIMTAIHFSLGLFLAIIGNTYRERSMFQLKPGSLAIIIGARTTAGRRNIGKSVELFGLCQPGMRFMNPVNGVMTQLPATADRALWLVTGDVYAFDNQHGFAFIRPEHLLPLTPDEASQTREELTIG
jgi:hypothetical protein